LLVCLDRRSRPDFDPLFLLGMERADLEQLCREPEEAGLIAAALNTLH
jgi:hypothetical protein